MVNGAPYLMKLLSVAGTVAMFLVGGGILVHGIPPLQHMIEAVAVNAGGVLARILPTVADGAVGVAVGALVVMLILLMQRFIKVLKAGKK